MGLKLVNLRLKDSDYYDYFFHACTFSAALYFLL